MDLSGRAFEAHIKLEAAGAEPPCFISLSLVPTGRPVSIRAPFSFATSVMRSYPDNLLRRVLACTRTIACVGISKNAARPSFYVARYLRSKGFRVTPVNPGIAGETLLGETVRPDLASLPVDLGSIDMVDVFRRLARAGEVVDAALTHLSGRGLRTWMQIGVIDEAAAARAEAEGVTVIMNRCPKIEYQRLHGEIRMGGFSTGLMASRL